MMKKVVKREEIAKTYKQLADAKADKGDFFAALGLYLTVLKMRKNDPDAIADVADCYADMGLLELSNRYWFEYLTVAPKDKESVAYEELAINFFYMDNLWASGYYFHLKVERDGFIAEEGLDEEIIKFFSSDAVKKEAYYIAYPFDKADYSSVAKSAKRAFAAGDIGLSVRTYAKIPQECRTEEVSGDYAVSLFLDKKDDEMIQVCKDSVAKFGDNVNAYCSLSSLFHARGDNDKADYYYARALQSRKGDKNENYKIVACAIEREDDATAKACMDEILKERAYDDLMNFFYGVALVNTGDYKGAEKAFATAHRINPKDSVYGYYCRLAEKIVRDNSVADEFLPLKYEKALPTSEERADKRQINGLINGKIAYSSLALDKTAEMLKIALSGSDVKTAKSAAFLLSASGTEQDKEALFSALLDNDVDDEVKSSVLYLLVTGGEKRKINAVFGNFFASIKPRKVVFERRRDGDLFMSAYGLAVAKCMFWGVNDAAKIAFNLNTLYTDYGELIRFNGFGAECISALCVLMCDFSRFGNVNAVCAAFGVDKSQVKALDEFYGFVKETKTERARARTAELKKEKKVDKNN